VADHFEVRRNVLQHFADIFSESIERTTTARTLTRRCMHLIFTRQVIRQRFTHWLLFYAYCRRYGRRRNDQLGGTGLEFFERQLELRDLAIELFRGATELLSSQLGDLQLQVFDQQIAALELHVGRVQCRATLDDESLQVFGMGDLATALRSRLGPRAEKVPTLRLPNALVRFLSLLIPALRAFTPELSRRNEVTSAKARGPLGFAPRPAATTVIECAESLLGASAL
jgi:hypothetical protein